MYKLILTINPEADNNYFNKWLRDNYTPNFKGSSQGDRIYLYFDSEPDEDVKTDITDFYNDIVQTDWLNYYKAIRFSEINNKTQELINLGYVYNGFAFSLSEKAQTNILALYSTKDDVHLIYPILFNTIDDLNTFEAVDANIIADMYYTALATKKAHLDGGTVLKNQIRQATTVDDVDAVQDNR